MKIKYSLTKEDFLAYQLYTSSRSDRIRKRRLRSRFIVPILYLLIALAFMFRYQQVGVGIGWILIALIWYFCYPLYARWRYERHYVKHIEENYQNRIDREVELEFDHEALYGVDSGSKIKVDVNEIDVLIETKDHFFIRLKTNSSFILPKSAISDHSELKEHFTTLGVNIMDETKWVWK